MSPMRRIMSFRDFDWTLFGFVALLCTISVLEIYSATLHTKYVGFHTKQIYWILGGVIAMFLFSLIDYHKLIDWVPWAYGVCLVALLAVKVIGVKVLGAKRWIKIGPMHFQPSEWVKLILILAVARYFANLGGKNLTWKEIFKAFALVGVPMLLVLAQPDMGTALTYTPVLIAGLFLGGINLKQALILTTAGLVLVAGAWNSGKVLKPYQKARLTGLLTPIMIQKARDTRCCKRRLQSARAESGAREQRKGRRRRELSFPFRMRTSSLPPSVKSMGLWAQFLCCCYTSSY